MSLKFMQTVWFGKTMTGLNGCLRCWSSWMVRAKKNAYWTVKTRTLDLKVTSVFLSLFLLICFYKTFGLVFYHRIVCKFWIDININRYTVMKVIYLCVYIYKKNQMNLTPFCFWADRAVLSNSAKSSYFWGQKNERLEFL